MGTQAPPRPQLKHAMTATAFALIQVRNTWRSYFTALGAERRLASQRKRQGR